MMKVVCSICGSIPEKTTGPDSPYRDEVEWGVPAVYDSDDKEHQVCFGCLPDVARPNEAQELEFTPEGERRLREALDKANS